jgi:lipopolysaccharide export system protein LptA
VLISSPDEIVRAEYGTYNVETGIATLTGSVKITRGNNQLNGARARVNLNTGVSSILGGANGVRGYLSPEQMGKRKNR